MGRLGHDMGYQREAVFVGRIGLHNLRLVSLSLMAIIGGIGVRGILEGIGGDILVRLY
jgi:hypothetical protein